MRLRSTLACLARVIADEAERNPDFARRVGEALGLADDTASGKPRAPIVAGAEPRARNRRPAPVLDPVVVAREGEGVLRSRQRSSRWIN